MIQMCVGNIELMQMGQTWGHSEFCLPSSGPKCDRCVSLLTILIPLLDIWCDSYNAQEFSQSFRTLSLKNEMHLHHPYTLEQTAGYSIIIKGGAHSKRMHGFIMIYGEQIQRDEWGGKL